MTESVKKLLSCACFFMAPGLAYAIITSRMPALKLQAGITEQQIGILLFVLGCFSLAALAVSPRIAARMGSRRMAPAGACITALAAVAACAGTGFWSMGAAFACTGFGLGLIDVAANTQGMLLERHLHRPCMAFLHGAYSLGAVIGSASGFAFAGLGQGPFVNALAVLACYALLVPLAAPRLLGDMVPQGTGDRPAKVRIPAFIILCGLLSMMAYSVDGSVAEWGSLFLYACKGADEKTAALVYGSFSVTTVLARLFADRLRQKLGDRRLSLAGAALGALGMGIVLFMPGVAWAVAGYGIMGIGMSPLVPIFFSEAGAVPGVPPARSSAVVSFFAYAGMLFFPPVLGFLAGSWGLAAALAVPFAECLLLFAGCALVIRARSC